MANKESKVHGLEPLDEESPEAYEAYRVYAMLPYTDSPEDGKRVRRSTDRVGRRLGKSSTLVEGWCTRYDWVKRAKRYDQHVAESIAEEFEDEMKEMARRQARQGLNISNTMANEIAKRIRNGDLEKESLRDIINAYRVGVETERTARVISHEHAENGGEVVNIEWD